MKGGTALVVDDDPGSCEYAGLALRQSGCSVRTAPNGIKALLAIEREVPGLVISDLHMPAMDGMELLKSIRARWPEVPVILFSADEEIAENALEAGMHGAFAYLPKPVSLPRLLAAAANALARTAFRSAPGPATGEVPEIVGNSAAIVLMRHHVVLAARSNVHVMIVGETGTGKELVARAVHRLSSRAGRPFVPHNCSQGTTEMSDDEFFGHGKSAYTGADRDRAGLVRKAHGGVLFLDELQSLSPANQAKLLRVIGEGEVKPVGSDDVEKVSVRFISATNRPPQVMIASGELRADLYWRLREFQIELVPLRERREDIPVLAAHFLAHLGASLSPRALDALGRCSWPGNVRQLDGVLRGACALAGTGQVDLRHLDLRECRPSTSPPPPSSPTPGGTLEEMERHAIRNGLEANDYNVMRTAKALDIGRATLRKKMEKFGLKRPQR